MPDINTIYKNTYLSPYLGTASFAESSPVTKVRLCQLNIRRQASWQLENRCQSSKLNTSLNNFDPNLNHMMSEISSSAVKTQLTFNQ